MDNSHIVRGTASGLVLNPDKYEELRTAISEDVGTEFRNVREALIFLGFLIRGCVTAKVHDGIYLSVGKFEDNLKLIAPYMLGKARLSMELDNGETKEFQISQGKAYRMKPMDLWELDSCL